jgi:hypothetical protein
MNTGIQDAYNLAWKLALVLKGQAGERLLDTYNEERLENAKNLLRTTDRMFQLVAGPEWFIAFLRTNVFPAVAGYLFTFDSVRRFAFPLVSQIGINYRHGSLSRHDGDEDFKVKAGDRMPYFSVDGESVYDRLREAKLHLLAFTDAQGSTQSSEREAERRYAELVDFHTLPLSPQAAEAFGAHGPFAVLLRPDNYVGFISAGTSSDELKAYLDDFIGLKGR